MPVVGCVERADASAPLEFHTASVFGAADLAATCTNEADVASAGQRPKFGEKGCRTGPLHGDDYARSVEAGALLKFKHPVESRKGGRGTERGERGQGVVG